MGFPSGQILPLRLVLGIAAPSSATATAQLRQTIAAVSGASKSKVHGPDRRRTLRRCLPVRPSRSSGSRCLLAFARLLPLLHWRDLDTERATPSFAPGGRRCPCCRPRGEMRYLRPAWATAWRGKRTGSLPRCLHCRSSFAGPTHCARFGDWRSTFVRSFQTATRDGLRRRDRTS
jgi:hypothetical protein